MKSSKIVFFGNERLSSGFKPQGAPTLEKLIHYGYNIVTVVANYESPTSRKTRELEILDVAQNYNIPVLLPKKLRDATEALQKLEADVGVLVAYGKIIPQDIIDIFPHGIVNIHPSLLPRYRGPTPIEQAILDGATQTGVSLMQLTAAMDAGPIYGQRVLNLTGTETKQEVTTELLHSGSDLLLHILPNILTGTAPLTPQNESLATYTKLLNKTDSVMNTSLKTAPELERETRAFAGWPKSRLTLFNQQIVVISAKIASAQDSKRLIIPCANGTYLEVTKLIAPSGRTISGTDFMRGYNKQL